MYHLFINWRTIDWCKNIWYILPFPTNALLICSSTRNSGILVRLACARKWQELFRMVIIPILCSFGPNVFLHNDNCLAKMLSGNLPIIKILVKSGNFQISLIPPPSLCITPKLPPNLQFSSVSQDFDESRRWTHGIWKINSILDVSLKLVMLHHIKVHFPGKLAIWNPKIKVV